MSDLTTEARVVPWSIHDVLDRMSDLNVIVKDDTLRYLIERGYEALSASVPGEGRDTAVLAALKLAREMLAAGSDRSLILGHMDDAIEQAEPDKCPICAEPFKADDLCALDVTEGTCHAECLEGSPIVDLDTDEPSDGPIFTFPYGSDETLPAAPEAGE